MLLVQDLATLAYRPAWQLQEQIHAQVLDGAPERLLLVEHPPVITFGRRPVAAQHLVASQDQLAAMGVELVESDRGGDVTFHGPGQLVAYPIIRLADHRLSVSGYVHTLEKIVIATLADFGIPAHTDPSAVGVWVPPGPSFPHTQDAKIAAIGVRIRRGASLHGLALNLSTDLRFFNLIVPCGLQGRPVTTMQLLLGPNTPTLKEVKTRLIHHMTETFNRP